MEEAQKDILLQMGSHLEQIQNLLSSLTGTPREAPVAQEQSKLLELYRASEKRANEAEVKLSKVQREIDLIRERASASVRDIQKLAFQDELTGLANSHLITQHLENLSSSSSLNSQTVVLIVDIDHFQTVNSVYGHELGDQLLIRVGERLNQLSGNSGAVGRLSEDEFVIVATGIPLNQIAESAANLAETVWRSLVQPFHVQGQKIELTISQGASVMPEAASEPKELIRQARTALSHAKNQGRNQFHFYDARLRQKIRRDASLELQLQYILEANEIFIEYLPFVRLEKASGSRYVGRLVGVEALLRWNHRVEGVLPPEQFLPIAEKTGHIVAIGEDMVRRVCAQKREWTRKGLDLFVAINLTGRQLLEPELALKLQAEAQRTEIQPGEIILEFREDFDILREVSVDQNLTALGQAGFRTALDRFGETAFNLQRLNLADFLKLSPHLLEGDRTLCHQAAALGRSLGLECIGVGVENAETAKFLLQLGCHTMQGFFFSEPLDPTAVARLVEETKVWNI